MDLTEANAIERGLQPPYSPNLSLREVDCLCMLKKVAGGVAYSFKQAIGKKDRYNNTNHKYIGVQIRSTEHTLFINITERIRYRHVLNLECWSFSIR